MKIADPEAKPGGELIISRDRAANRLIQQLEKSKGLPLITVHGPAGVGKSDLAGPVLCQRLRGNSGGKNSHPVLHHIHITGESAAIDLALEVCDIIIDHHSDFKSRKSATVFREKMERSIRRSPYEAAERLRAMMRNAEKSKLDLEKIQLVICLDDVDKLFEKRAKQGSELSKTAICGGASDPLGFIRRLVGMKTILFALVYRSWVSHDVNEILSKAGIQEPRRIDINLVYPDPEEVDRIVKKMVIPFKNGDDAPASEIDSMLDDLIQTISKNPATLSLLPDVLKPILFERDGLRRIDRSALEDFLAQQGLTGQLSKRADSLFLRQTTAGKLALEELFAKMMESDGKLQLKDVADSEELWTAALAAVESRIMAIDGPSFHRARFVPTHFDLLSTWNRAVDWKESERIVGFSQLNEFDDQALTWELSDRNRALLVLDEEGLEDARTILKDSELSHQVHNLTREFLQTSLRVKAGKDARSFIKRAMVPVSAGLSGLLMIGIVSVIVILAVDEDEVTSQDANADSSELASAAGEPPGESEIDPELATLINLSVRERVGQTPGAGDLLVSAEKISMTADEVPEEVPLLPELDVIPLIEESIDRSSGGEDFETIAEIAPEEFKTMANEAGQLVLPATRTVLNPAEKKVAGGKAKPDKPASKPKILPRKTGDKRGRMEIVTAESTWREILNAMGHGIARADSDVVIDALNQFHEKSVLYPDEIKNIQLSEFKDLASHLGKVALMQKDRAAMQSAWNLELVSQNVVDLNTNLRMLMARLALNAGREHEAVAYLAQTRIQKNINSESVDFIRAAVGFHFNEGTKATESFRKLLSPQASVEYRKL